MGCARSSNGMVPVLLFSGTAIVLGGTVHRRYFYENCRAMPDDTYAILSMYHMNLYRILFLGRAPQFGQ